LHAVRCHRKKSSSRTLTPRHLKCDKKWTVDRVNEEDDDESDESPLTIKKEIEMGRKMKRDMARDRNRPNLNDDFDETIVITDIDEETDWIEDDDEGESKGSAQNCERKSSASGRNSSLEYLRLREIHQKRQQQMRRKSFYTNRRRSSNPPLKLRVTTETASSIRNSDDLERYQSCKSIERDSYSNMTPNSFSTPTKSFRGSFVNTHFATVNRMSDYRVPPREFLREGHAGSPSTLWTLDIEDLKRPLPLLIISFLTIGLVASIYARYVLKKD
jgi:hypothetical protein